MHAIDSVFDSDPSPPRRQAISANKIEKGDAAFSTKKCVLGWDVDTAMMQLSLPAHRLASLSNLLSTFLQKK
jgi:hypothetical protein